MQFSIGDLHTRRILRVGQAVDRVGVARLDGAIGDIADQHAADLDLIEVDCVAEFIGECRARLQIDATRSDSAATRVRDNSALPAVAADFIGGGPAIIPDLDIAAKDGVVIRDREGISIILGVPSRCELEPVATGKPTPVGKGEGIRRKGGICICGHALISSLKTRSPNIRAHGAGAVPFGETVAGDAVVSSGGLDQVIPATSIDGVIGTAADQRVISKRAQKFSCRITDPNFGEKIQISWCAERESRPRACFANRAPDAAVPDPYDVISWLD